MFLSKQKKPASFEELQDVRSQLDKVVHEINRAFAVHVQVDQQLQQQINTLRAHAESCLIEAKSINDAVQKNLEIFREKSVKMQLIQTAMLQCGTSNMKKVEEIADKLTAYVLSDAKARIDQLDVKANPVEPVQSSVVVPFLKQ